MEQVRTKKRVLTKKRRLKLAKAYDSLTSQSVDLYLKLQELEIKKRIIDEIRNDFIEEIKASQNKHGTALSSRHEGVGN